MSEKGIILIVSGPSGVGKGTICKALIEKYPDEYAMSISVTSRDPRENETHGIEYFFHTKAEVEEMIEQDMLLEHAVYVNNYYGTPRQWVENKLSEGLSVILEIDYQGGFQVASKTDNVVMVFIMPPSVDELMNRLTNRGTETEEQIKQRLLKAEEEILVADKYDYIIVNEEVEKSVEMLHNIVLDEKNRRFV